MLDLDPSADLDFGFDWAPLTNGRPGARSDWLADGETIISQTVTAPTGVTVSQVSQSSGTVTYWLSGGVLGQHVRVTCHIVTSEGREDSRSETVRIVDR